ncbi:SusC/RagA family TonB-linked outer membrane protein [Flavobacteriaceae bacterium F08102]|nr:SusC/RagA family TonB-linked outer membrane protein [Flavobacteriaceae bacterium F08102]
MKNLFTCKEKVVPILKKNLKMKLSVLFSFVIICTLQANTTNAQHKITLNVKNTSIASIIDEIETTTDFKFIFRTSVINLKRKFSLNVKEENVETVLKILFNKTNTSFEVLNSKIFLSKSTHKLGESRQQISVKGIVRDQGGVPIPGVTIRLKGTAKATSTDLSGEFHIQLPSGNNVLVFSSIGYQSKEVIVGDQISLTITLEESINELEEVVLSGGYYSTTERLKTGNISKVTAKEISRTPVANPMGALQGRIPGMVITQSSGNPGAAFEVEIRGRTQIDQINGASDEPLYIIDNVPLASGNEYINQLNSAISASSLSGLSPLYSLNLADIESIEILKDADATAIYGSRGASGVVLITTKKGKTGKSTFNISASSGISVAPLPDMLSTKEYVAMRMEALANDGLDLETLANSSRLSDRNKVYDLAQYDTSRDENLTKQLIGGTAHTTDFQASISGGTELTQYILSGGYHEESMVVPGDFPNSRASGRFHINTRSKDKKFNGAFSASYASTLNTSSSTDLSFALSLAPNYQLYDKNGDLAWNEGGYKSNNPLSYLLKKYEAQTNSLNANAVLSYQILPGLTLKSSVGYNLITSDENRITPSTAINPLDRTGADGTYLFGHNTFKSWIVEPQLEYNKKFKTSTLSILAGGSFQSQESKGYQLFVKGYEDDDQIGSLAVVTPDMLFSPTSNFSEYKYAAVFGRINYNFLDKYILNLSGRRDGSSRFGPNYRFSNFGAIGGAWIFSKEAFMEDLSFITFAKLRGSYGVTGNDKIGNYKYQDVYTAGFSTSSYNGDPALTPASLFNPNLHWERNIKTEFALDLYLIKDRFQISTAWYSNISSDPLVSYPLPTTTGYSSVVNNLEGVKVQNKGLELQLSSRNFNNENLRWSTSFNLTIPSNKLVEFPNFEESSYTSNYAIGKSLNTVIVGHVLGVDSETGLYKLKDYNDNGMFDSAIDGDFRPQLDTDPDFYGGLQNSISYKGVTLDVLFQYKKQMGRNWIGSYTSFTSPVGAVGVNYPDVVLNRWQNPGDQTDIQRFTTSGSFLDLYNLNGGHVPAYFSDLQYTDVSFVRLKNVSLSYNLPKDFLGKIGLQSMRIYTQGHNLLTFTPYKIGDPETATLNRLPPLRTFIFGAQISF